MGINNFNCGGKMDIQISKQELDSITNFQREMHQTTNKEPITSIFYKEQVKSTWHVTQLMPFESVVVNDESDRVKGTEVCYTVNKKFHYLIYSYLRFVLPCVKVHPKYVNRVRIAWCHNVGTNIVKRATFKDDELFFQSWDNIWLDDCFQWCIDEGKERNHNIGVGSVPILEEWNTMLPSYPINVDQPWFYGEEPGMAYPIYLRGAQCKAEHRYLFRLKITDLLRMQLKIDDNWVNVETAKHINYLQYNNINISKPTLWGRYGYVTDNEMNTNKCKINMKPRVFYYKDVEICDNEKDITYKYGTPTDNKITSKNPCLAMFWKAENIDATKFNNYSNYTCNTNDLHSGWDPIKFTTNRYGNKDKFTKMESDHFNIAESRKHSKSSPREQGYHMLSICNNSSNYHIEAGITPIDLDQRLICDLAKDNMYEIKLKPENTIIDTDNDNFSYNYDEPEYVQEESPNFRMRVRLLVVKKLTITYDKDTNNYIFKIE